MRVAEASFAFLRPGLLSLLCLSLAQSLKSVRKDRASVELLGAKVSSLVARPMREKRKKKEVLMKSESDWFFFLFFARSLDLLKPQSS